MKTSDPYPFHNRQITPWYATPAICWTLMIVMLGIFAFSLVGISVARSEAAFNGYLWVPATLCAVSGAVALLMAWRLVRRRFRRRSVQAID